MSWIIDHLIEDRIEWDDETKCIMKNHDMNIDDFFWLVEEQLPPRLRDKLHINVQSDPYHLRTTVTFTSKADTRVQHECELEPIRCNDARSLALKISDKDIAHLCMFFN